MMSMPMHAICTVPLLILLILIGCETTPTTSGGAGGGSTVAGGGTLAAALADYNAGRYNLAHQKALDAMRSASSADREQAAYLAGLSAYQSGDYVEAELRLSSAINAADPHTSASAKAMLGQVRLARGTPGSAAEAARLFEEAARGFESVSPEDARQAARFASMAHQQAGNTAAANHWQQVGSTAASTGAVNAGRPGAAPTGFAIQVGAFQDRHRATQAADEVAAIARREGLTPPWIVPKPDSRGRVLYVVQFGTFSTRTSAQTAHSRIGRQEFIVAPALR